MQSLERGDAVELSGGDDPCPHRTRQNRRIVCQWLRRRCAAIRGGAGNACDVFRTGRRYRQHERYARDELDTQQRRKRKVDALA